MDIQTIQKKIRGILVEKNAKTAMVFGSVARGTHDRRSDIDILIVDEEEMHYLDRLSKYYRDICACLKNPVDLLVYTPEELKAIRNRPFIKKALEEGISIYER